MIDCLVTPNRSASWSSSLTIHAGKSTLTLRCCNPGCILTNNEEEEIKTPDGMISMMPVWKWALA